MGGASVRLENVTVVYNQGTSNETIALDNVSLEIAAGETVLLVGGNGSGKSTLLKVIAGTIKPVSGKIFFDDVDVTARTDIRRAKRVGFVHQDSLLGTCPNLTFFENTIIPSSEKWWWPFPYSHQLQRDVISTLELMGIEYIAHRVGVSLNSFSGGQRQAIALAIALNRKSDFLLLDEYSSSLDAKVTDSFHVILRDKIARRERTQLIISHDMQGFDKFGCVESTESVGQFKIFRMSKSEVLN